MNIMEAIEKRISCRAFTTDPIPDSTIEALAREIDLINADSGLNFQLRGAKADGSPAFDLSDRMFAGTVPWFAAFVGADTDEDKELVGYYGERFVLLATQLGLGSCWVAGTFDRENAVFDAREGDVLHDIIPLGYAVARIPLKQRTVRAGLRRRDKKPQAMLAGIEWNEAPEWVREGIRCVILGPSAINEQPVVFEVDADGVVHGTIPAFRSGMELTDLGIAKLQFQLAAAAAGVNGTWEWGEGGKFVLD